MKTIKRIEECTDNNDHNEARRIIADDLLCSPYYNGIIKSLQYIHAQMGHMDKGLLDFRDTLTNSMLNDVEHQYGEDMRKQVYAAL